MKLSKNLDLAPLGKSVYYLPSYRLSSRARKCGIHKSGLAEVNDFWWSVSLSQLVTFLHWTQQLNTHRIMGSHCPGLVWAQVTRFVIMQAHVPAPLPSFFSIPALRLSQTHIMVPNTLVISLCRGINFPLTPAASASPQRTRFYCHLGSWFEPLFQEGRGREWS